MKNIFITLGIIIVLVGAYFLVNNQKDKVTQTDSNYVGEVYVFKTDTNEVTAQYSDTGEKMKMTLDGKEYNLHSVVSGSGARYANDDESVVFWEHQGEATVEIDGKMVVEGAKLQNKPTDTTKKDDNKEVYPLQNTSWQWEQTKYSDNRLVTPNKPTAFVLAFGENQKFSSTTDCNVVMGEYEILNTHISFDKMASTKMACEDKGSQESTYTEMLSNGDGYEVTNAGNLVLTLKEKAGEMTFTPIIMDAEKKQ